MRRNAVASFSLGFLLTCILLSSGSVWAQRANGIGNLQEGIQFSIAGFSKENKSVVIRVSDPQRGTYFSVYSARTGEKVQDIPFQAEDEKAVYRKLKKKEGVEDEGSSGAVSPRDGTLITGIFNGTDLALQVQAGSNVGFLDVLPAPSDDMKLKKAMARDIRWDERGKIVVVVASWEFEGNPGIQTESLHIYRFRPWKVKWQ